MIIRFDGKPVPANPGDTIASALYRDGRRVFSRSFKYHRPRGLLCCAGNCPNCMVDVDGIPNQRACRVPARDGMVVRHQNAWPSLETDALSVAQQFDFLMPAGWYYKTFTSPFVWHQAEPFIRKAAGLGEAPPPGAAEPRYEHEYKHAGVAVIGGGPAGIEAAIDAARRGASVVLVEQEPELGGHLRYDPAAGVLPVDAMVTLLSLPNVELLTDSYCFGFYEDGLLGVLRAGPEGGPRERLIHLRAEEVVVATGAYETLLPFENNDLPGVMLSTGALRLMRLHGVNPGKRVALIARDGGERVASALRQEGGEIAAVVDPADVLRARGRSRVTGLETRKGAFRCDLIVVCGPMVPNAGLIAQAGGGYEWDAARGAFVPSRLPAHVRAVGTAAGGGLSAAAAMPPRRAEAPKRTFVCLCGDVTEKDLCDGVAEGFDHIEMLKRYTTLTMGPCQGRMCQLTGIGICARETGRAMDQTGVTTSRPPNPSITLGALAGARHHPVRRTPMHHEHEDAGAVWLDMGEWKRPRFYATAQEPRERQAVRAEYQAVRERCGVIDVSTLGKLELTGRDAAALLDKVYTGRFADLAEGRVRYAVICDEAGVMLDDGTVSHLDGGRYFLTTTTGNLDFVQQWLEWWLAGSGLDVRVVNRTSGLASVNVAGPLARQVLQTITACSLENADFPYMHCRESEVAGVPALLMRIGFVGETGWEVHVPSESGADVWRAILQAGASAGIRPFGVEAQRLLRLEKGHVIVGVDTDALTSPFDAGMAWVAKLDKPDFVGRSALRAAAGSEPRERLVGFVMADAMVPPDGAAVVADGRPAGRVTSARFSPLAGRAIGMAWVPAAHAVEGTQITIRDAGRLGAAHVRLQPFYDPEGRRLRS